MAFEITELVITKLNLLCCKENNFSSSKARVPRCINELREFQKILKGAEDQETDTHTNEEWQKLIRDIYSLEDIIEPLICRTTLKSYEIFFIEMRLNNKIGKLRSKVRKLLPNNSNDVQIQHSEDVSDDMEQAPTSSDLAADNTPATVTNPEGSPRFKRTDSVDAPLPPSKLPSRNSSDGRLIVEDVDEDAIIPTSSNLGAGIVPISENNTPATVTNPEGSPRFRRTDSVGGQIQPRRLLSRNWTGRLILEDVDEDAMISDETWGETGENLEEKSVTVVLEGLVNKLAQPVLSSSKRQSLILKADVSCSGKSILLWTVYNAETVRQHFHFRAWINVSKVSDEMQIVNTILKQCNYDEEEDGGALRSPQQRFHDFLVWKRFLIVLYGVPGGLIWDSLESIFPYSLNGSRVILASPHSEGSKSVGEASDEWPQQQLVKYSGYLEDDSSIITAKAVIDELTESILSPRRLSFLISIVGVVGSGKTTLLWALYNAEDIQLHFQCCAWIHVPEVFNERDLLTDIWEQVTGVKTEILLPLKSLQQKLRSFLARKRYLVVLYDVWTAQIWECIKISLPNSLNGSRVVLGVQEVDVARKTKSWIFRITAGMELLHDLKDMQENDSEQMQAKRWERLSDIMDEASGVVGLEDKIQELAELVLNNYKLHFLVSVLGAAGSGKTTVVRTFYDSIASKQHFECRAWISVPQDFEEREILLDLYRQLRKAKENQSLTVEQLQKGLSLFLTWKRYLIVLDDVRTPGIWNVLKRVFPNTSNGSRVILTIRKAYLAYHLNPQPVVLSLRPLNKDESWKLFTEKVQTGIDDIPSNLKEKILHRCRGVPLTIVLLGGLMSTKNKGQNYTEWFDVIGQTGRRRENKKGVTGKDQLNSLNQGALLDSKQKHGKNDVIIANQMGSVIANQMGSSSDKNSIEDQSSSLAQPVHSYARQKEDKATREDPLTSPNQLSLFATEQKEAQSKVVTDNAISAEDQSTSSDELISPDELSLSNTVAVTYQHLSFSSKCCLLYLGMFPRSYEIPIRRLLQLWLAEELVMQPTGETKPLEDLAKSCFEELLRTNMIEIAKGRLDGSPKTCRVTNTIYDTLLLNAEKVGFFHIHRSSGTAQPPQSNIRRLAEHSDMYINTKPPEVSIQHLRSYISFYKKKGDAPTSGVSELLNKIIKGGFGMLIVLDLEGVYKPVLPEMLGKLRQLKYLGLRRTLLDSVPESVGGLPHLETLDIKQTYIITLPSSIWEAKRLQHLYMSEIYVDASIQKTSSHGTLSNLQTLWGLIIRRKLPKTDWLDNLSGLRKLKLTCLAESMKVIAGWFSKLSNLQSLKLRSISDSNEPASLALGEMKNLTNLSRLYLLGQLPESLNVIKLPANLEVLTLSVSNLTDDPMEAIGKLGKLKVLRLYARSFMGKSMTCHEDRFPKLQVLKLWMLENLQNWAVQQKAMPVLEELEIRYCKELKEINGLQNLTKLKELTLTNMEPQIVDDAEKQIKQIGHRVNIIKNQFPFRPPWVKEENTETAV